MDRVAGASRGNFGCTLTLARMDVLMVKPVPLPPAEAVGEKVQLAPAGSPEHENETVPEKSFAASTPTETLAD